MFAHLNGTSVLQWCSADRNDPPVTDMDTPVLSIAGDRSLKDILAKSQERLHFARTLRDRVK